MSRAPAQLLGSSRNHGSFSLRGLLQKESNPSSRNTTRQLDFEKYPCRRRTIVCWVSRNNGQTQEKQNGNWVNLRVIFKDDRVKGVGAMHVCMFISKYLSYSPCYAHLLTEHGPRGCT